MLIFSSETLPPKFTPVMVTYVPPAVGPDLGENCTEICDHNIFLSIYKHAIHIIVSKINSGISFRTLNYIVILKHMIYNDTVTLGAHSFSDIFLFCSISCDLWVQIPDDKC